MPDDIMPDDASLLNACMFVCHDASLLNVYMFVCVYLYANILYKHFVCALAYTIAY